MRQSPHNFFTIVNILDNDRGRHRKWNGDQFQDTSVSQQKRRRLWALEDALKSGLSYQWYLRCRWTKIRCQARIFSHDSVSRCIRYFVASNSKKENASGIVVSAPGDSPLHMVLEAEDKSNRMIKLFDIRYASCRTVSQITAQTQLFRMSYNEQNMP